MTQVSSLTVCKSHGQSQERLCPPHGKGDVEAYLRQKTSFKRQAFSQLCKNDMSFANGDHQNPGTLYVSSNKWQFEYWPESI